MCATYKQFRYSVIVLAIAFLGLTILFLFLYDTCYAQTVVCPDPSHRNVTFPISSGFAVGRFILCTNKEGSETQDNAVITSCPIYSAYEITFTVIGIVAVLLLLLFFVIDTKRGQRWIERNVEFG